MTTGSSRRPAAVVVLLLGWMLAALAVATIAFVPSAARAASSTTVSGTRPIVVEAPGALNDLLVANLDLVRATRLTGEAALDEGEWARLVAAAPAQARELAATEGYFQAAATVTVEPDAAHTIRVHVEPGEQAMVDGVTLQFDGDLDRAVVAGDADARAVEADLRRTWPMPEGTRFRNATWSDAKSKWLARVRGKGYGAATWSGTAATVDPQDNHVQLFLVVDSGPLFRAGNLVIEGLERQPESTVRNLAGFLAGQPLDEARLNDYQDRLQKTGLYDQVTVTYDSDPTQASHATVTVRVHEQSLHQATTAIGVSSDTGPRVSLEYADRKLFGYPITAAHKLVLGRDEQSYELDLTTQPDENFHSWLTGLLVDRLIATDENFLQDITDTQRVRFGRTRDTTRFDRLQFVQVERSVQCIENQPACTDARAVSVNQNTVWRRVDSVVLPTEGWTLRTEVGVGYTGGTDTAGGPNFKYAPYARLYARYTEYWPLPSQFYATGRIELGQVMVKQDIAVPDGQLFRAGGPDSVRGYSYRSLAPTNAAMTVVGGTALLTLSAEVAHPISEKMPSVWWATFVDAGDASLGFGEIDLKYGPGVGLRWRSPVGPLRIDVARDTLHHQTELSLSIGIAF
jgi:translocation and assembly module TamA